MKKNGKLTSWDDEKGYGFIAPSDGGDRVFVHIKAFANRIQRPIVGDAITYSASTDPDGRPRAESAAIAGVKKPARPNQPSGTIFYAVAAIFLLIVGEAVLLSAIPRLVLPLYLVLSSITFAAYALDKRAAKTGDWRTTESTLHLLSLAGGWPGALIAQGRLRHKTRKQPFRAIFWTTVLLNCAAFAGLFTPEGEAAWRSVVSAVPWG